MNLADLRKDIKRKIKTYGSASVTWGTVKQTIRPVPEDLDEAGKTICQGVPMDYRVDAATDSLVLTKSTTKFSAEEAERYWAS